MILLLDQRTDVIIASEPLSTLRNLTVVLTVQHRGPRHIIPLALEIQSLEIESPCVYGRKGGPEHGDTLAFLQIVISLELVNAGKLYWVWTVSDKAFLVYIPTDGRALAKLKKVEHF